jgi:hypothetical protein
VLLPPVRYLAAVEKPVRRAAVALAHCCGQARVSLTAYRPERHYMRGPGPKCRAKHDVLCATRRPATND